MTWIGSLNFTPGRQGRSIRHIVVHHMNGQLLGTDSTFQDNARDTSAHYGVGQNDIHQYVREEDTAYHAGIFSENLISVGIEHEDFARDEFTDQVYAQSAQLIRDICTRYHLPISRDTIHPHNEFKATACPGSLDIDRLIREASIMVSPEDTKAVFAQYGLGTPTAKQLTYYQANDRGVLLTDVLNTVYGTLQASQKALETCKSEKGTPVPSEDLTLLKSFVQLIKRLWN